MSLSSFHLENCRKILRFDVFPRLTPRLERTALAFVLFYFLFFIGTPYGLNATFGQSYSWEKTSWKSTRPRLESGSTHVSDVASKRADILLKSTEDRVSTSQTQTKSRSKPNASSLKTLRPSVGSSSLISPSSFSEKKLDLYASPNNARRSLEEPKEEQDELADKEKLFGELERRGRINLVEEEQKIESGLASFELTEPEFDEGGSLKEKFPEITPFPSDSLLSVSLDEEIEGVQDTRKNNYVSGLELSGSDLESEPASTDDATAESCPQTDGAPNDVETLDESASAAVEQINEDAETQEEIPANPENDVESASGVDDSILTEFNAPIVDLDELSLPEIEVPETNLEGLIELERQETEGVQESEEPSEEIEEIEPRQEEKSETSSEEETQIESETNVDVPDAPPTDERVEKIASLSASTSILSAIKSTEANNEENDLSPKEETDSDESNVPQTSSVPSAPSKPTRFSIPSHSILSLDDELEDELAPAPTEESVEVQTQTIEISDVSYPKTFAEETAEISKDSEEEAPSIVSELAELDEITKKGKAKQEETKSAIQEELNDEEKVILDSTSNDKSYDDFSASTTQAKSSKSDARLFTKLRVLQRGRQRRLFNGRLLETPAPPSIDDIDPEFANQRTEPPLLTKENANLPSLEVEGTVKAYKPESESVDAEKFREEAKKFAWTKGAFTIAPYGFLNLSVAADTQRSVPGEFILYVQSPEIDNSPDFSVDARTSRLGLDVAGPRVEALSADVGGKVEIDFQGSVNGSKNKGGLQLRRAYVELVDKRRERRFLAGQDWEIISPVAPQMLNYLPLGFVGDMQYRRAQVRFEQGWTCSPDLRVLGQAAVCDNVLSDYASTSGVSAATSGWPILEARLSGAFFGGVRDGLPITLGVSGHIGEQNYKFSSLAGVPMASTSVKRPIKTWSVNFDLDAPITKTQKIQGEFYTGSNLSTFCGGINQGVDLLRREGIRSSGGWLAWHSDCTEKMDVNFGYGIDKPNEKDLVGTSSPSNGYTTARTQNQVYFANCIYNWTPYFMTGLETSVWQTDYQKAYVASEKPIFYDMEAGKSTRIEFVTRLSF